ncbi:N-acetylmuramoyl-L-alanine amidase [Solilutibacter silvestris]|uniref:N-acetylmuramoyl-L-alanine amidase n=1 Tax=Solilutibacter silvestris TaxID=1645665 RepID=UPI003D32A1DC
MILLLLALPSWAADVRAVRVSQGATGTRAEIQLDRDAQYTIINLDNPRRLVVDFKDSAVSSDLPMPYGAGLVRGVRSGTPEPGSARLVFDLRGDTVAIRPHMESNANGRVLVIEWPDDGEGDARPVAAATQSAPATTSEPQLVEQPPAQQPVVERPPVVVAPPPNTTPTAQAPVRTVADVAKRGGGRPLLIAIDAGHGGQDTGAHGAAGSLEKNITLQVAKELARQVNATPGMKAYLTRDSDFFIPLVRRYQLARQHKADMFVAIHADAFTDPSASGSSVWVLSRRGQTSQAARWLADQENAADLVGGVRLRDKDNTLASVLLDLSQSATQRASEEIASQVLRGLADLGKTHRGEIDRANFVVLRSPDVPSMLVETAFISNPGEERKLNNPDYQRELARAVLNGIHTYFRRQPPPGTQYAAMYMGGASNTAARP